MFNTRLTKVFVWSVVVAGLAAAGCKGRSERKAAGREAEGIFSRMRAHDFEDNKGSGVADLNDTAWRVRTLAIRDLVRLGDEGVPAMIAGLSDADRHVRHICATALGVLGAKEAGKELTRLVTDDSDPIVSGQATDSLGLIGYGEAEPLIERLRREGGDRHIRHRAIVAHGRFTENATTYPELIEAWRDVDESRFRLAKVGRPAPDFELADTTGKSRRLSDFKGKKTVVLIWIFADWCPVCHREFHDLNELEAEFEDNDIQVLTIECHDLYRCRIMAEGRDIWGPFLAEWSPKSMADIAEAVQARKSIWWPHLVDPAGAIANMYGCDFAAFTVHQEWVNRPSTVIVDKEGIVRFAYYGTFWGDRPTIEQTLEMVKSGQYEFEHPARKKIITQDKNQNRPERK